MPLNGIQHASPIAGIGEQGLTATRKDNRKLFFDDMRRAVAKGLDHQQNTADVKSATFAEMRKNPHRPAVQTDDQLKDQVGNLVDRELCRKIAAELTAAATPAEREKLQDLETASKSIADTVRENISAFATGSRQTLGGLARRIVQSTHPAQLALLMPSLPMVVATECPDTPAYQDVAQEFVKHIRDCALVVQHLPGRRRMGFHSTTFLNDTDMPAGQSAPYVLEINRKEGDNAHYPNVLLHGPVADVNVTVANGRIRSEHLASINYPINASDCETVARAEQVTSSNFPSQIENLRMMWDALCCNLQTNASSMLDYIQSNPQVMMDFRGHVENSAQFHGVATVPTTPASISIRSQAEQSTFAGGTFALGMAAGAAAIGAIFAAKAAYNFLHARGNEASGLPEQAGQRRPMLTAQATTTHELQKLAV